MRELNYECHMLPPKDKLDKLRRVITENLRVQKSGAPTIPYIDVAHALPDAQARQNHVAFGRRGCGKTLLLHESALKGGAEERVIYLNCEDFKHHTFPNVLIEILDSILAEMEQHITGWFGKKKKSQQLLQSLRQKLHMMKTSDDERQQHVVEKTSSETAASARASLGGTNSGSAEAKLNAPGGSIGAGSTSSSSLSFSGDYAKKQAMAVETAYARADSKIRDLNMLLPEFKKNLGEFFALSTKVKTLFLQIDDFYHLSRTVQPHVMDYIHRLCKDLPIYFKIATLRHASVLYAERSRQPVGAQERHDYQPINIDFTFQEFPKRRNRFSVSSRSSQRWQTCLPRNLKRCSGATDSAALLSLAGACRAIVCLSFWKRWPTSTTTIPALGKTTFGSSASRISNAKSRS